MTHKRAADLVPGDRVRVAVDRGMADAIVTQNVESPRAKCTLRDVMGSTDVRWAETPWARSIGFRLVIAGTLGGDVVHPDAKVMLAQ